VNLFGEGSPSQQAKDYFQGTAIQRAKFKLDAVGMSLQGEPISLWAGPVSTALGVEARRETANQTNGPQDRLTAGTGLALISKPVYSGKNTTKEAFTEIQLPVIKDLPALRLLQLNGAARITDDQSGSVWSWKLGLTDEVLNGVQLRFARSRDIRAANLFELYSVLVGPSFPTIIDPVLGTSYRTSQFTGGNPDLEPELALTTTAGITITPPSIQELNLSVDYYDIKVENAIGTLLPQSTVALCFAGNQSICDSAIVRDPVTGQITTIFANNQNFVSFRTRGFDLALDYALPIAFPGGGKLRVRSNATWVKQFDTDTGLVVTDGLGESVAKLRANAAIYYDTSRFTGNVRARYFSAGVLSNTLSIQNNDIPALVYLDLGFNVKIPRGDKDGLELYAEIDNLLDKDPPPGLPNSAYYDLIGRYYTLGARLRF
jgi:outer membrane receptor protein involved in Fe transport